MHFIWRDEHMPLFLKLYREHECLWNNKTSSYNNSGLRERAYGSLVRELNIPGLTVAHVKAKIKTIRTRYSTELAKVLRSEDGGGDGNEIYEPRLFWFREADSFLRAVCIPKRSYWSGQTFGITNELNPCTENSYDLDIKVKYEMAKINCASECDNMMDSRKHKIEGPAHHYPEKVMKSGTQLDEFDLFCNSLAVQLRKMPLDRALLCQEKLQAVMTHERLAYIMETEKAVGLVQHEKLPVECVMEDEHAQRLSQIIDGSVVLSPS